MLRLCQILFRKEVPEYMTSLLNIAIALLAGLLMTRVFNLWNLPDVTAFLSAGLLIGPCALGRLGISGLGFPTYENVESLSLLSDVAMGFIAFSIGTEFRLESLQKTGRQAFVIGIVQALTAAVLVDLAMAGLHFWKPELLSLPAAITLGAIATATAPAATLMVVRQYKAKGKLTDLLLPIVALDDAVGLIVFAVSFGIAQAVEGGTLSVISVVVNPIVEIICSLLLGAVMGIIMSELEKLFFSNSNRLSMTIAFVTMTIALSSLRFSLGPVTISFSSLLVCMMLGTAFCNMSLFSPDIMSRAEKWTSPLYAVFFVLSGAQLELSVFRYPSVILIGIVYIVIRCAGKYFGARLSAAATHCSDTVQRYLGITLFPQAGVALGMVVTAQALGSSCGSMIRNIILFSVMIYEIFGPMMTRDALRKAGEITPVSPEKKTRDRFAHRREAINKRQVKNWPF